MRALRPIPLLLAVVLGAHAAPTRRLGLMIGVDDGGRDRVRLKYAGSDASAFALSMRELGGFDSEDIILARETDSAGLARALDQLAARAAEAKRDARRVEAVIFFSGHADEQGLLLRGRHFGFREFRNKVEGVPADVRIAIVDACASGALTKMKGGQSLPAFLSDQSNQATGYAFLTSSSENEAAQESDRIRASFFSHYLIMGLRGAADASQDGRVTLHEAYQYAYHETLDRTENTVGGPQHAGYDMSITGSGDVVMTELNRARTTLHLAGDAQGLFFIRDSDDRLVAEVRKIAGHPLVFALEPGPYKTRWHQAGGIYEQDFILTPGMDLHLEPGATWRRVSPEFAVARGDGSNGGDGPPRASRFRVLDNHAEDDFRGTLLSLVSNRSGGYFEGLQLSGVLNLTASDFQGTQITTALNYAGGPLQGSQIALAFNWAGDVLRGVQFSNGMNYARSMSDGLQAAGVFNLARGEGRGIQGAAFLNTATGGLDGGQVAAFANTVGGDLQGAQIGGANFAAGVVEGYQIGIINVARSYRRGAPLGLINLVGDGVWRGDVWLDESGFTHVGLVSGTRFANTRLAIGGKRGPGGEVGALSVEMAGHLPLRPAFLELGLMSSLVDGGDGSSSSMPEYLQRLRFTAGVDLGRWVSVAAGASWAALIVPEGQPAWIRGNWLQRSDWNGRLLQWPGFHVSVRAGTY